MNLRNTYYVLVALLLFASCANIVAPTGGDKDINPPKLVRISPADSQLNVRTSKIRLEFDEYVTLADASSQVLISPILPVPPTVTSLNKHVVVSFPDSLLLDNTTYHVTFGGAIRDNHEGNVYVSKGYIFSTGPYFDSLTLSGHIINATTGFPDTGATVVLYPASGTDSAFLRQKPMYATHVNNGGDFLFQGLPQRRFNIYALHDKNGSLAYDDRAEWIGFYKEQVTPGMDSLKKIVMRAFPPAGADTAASTAGGASGSTGGFGVARSSQKGNYLPEGSDATYRVVVDTGDKRRRTFDITQPLILVFAKKPVLQTERIFLSCDSAEVTIEVPFTTHFDTATNQLQLKVNWMEDAMYTLRLQKGFAKDSSGKDLMPGRYSFRTKRDDDYARLTINLPPRYQADSFVLQVSNETDTIYQQTIRTASVELKRIPPGNYKLRVIADRNKNGHWDTGDLFAHLQPEEIYPYDQTILLKAGWENQVDFDRQPDTKKSPEKSPGAVPR